MIVLRVPCGGHAGAGPATGAFCRAELDDVFQRNPDREGRAAALVHVLLMNDQSDRASLPRQTVAECAIGRWDLSAVPKQSALNCAFTTAAAPCVSYRVKSRSANAYVVSGPEPASVGEGLSALFSVSIKAGMPSGLIGIAYNLP